MDWNYGVRPVIPTTGRTPYDDAKGAELHPKTNNKRAVVHQNKGDS